MKSDKTKIVEKVNKRTGEITEEIKTVVSKDERIALIRQIKFAQMCMYELKKRSLKFKNVETMLVQMQSELSQIVIDENENKSQLEMFNDIHYAKAQ